MRAAALLFVCASLLPAAGVRVLFNPADPAVGPFPTDFLTVPDTNQKSGLRVNMPLPDCSAEPSTCGELSIVNQYDGFALQPRLVIHFSGPVNPDTLRAGVHLVFLDSLLNDEYKLGPSGEIIPINQVVYDPSTNTAYAQPDFFIDETRRFALVITDAVRDTAGDPVEADPAYSSCVGGQTGGEYCAKLAHGTLAFGNGFFVPTGPARTEHIVGGSVFTTMSATDFLQRARASLSQTPPNVQRPQGQAVFTVANLSSFTWHEQVQTSASGFHDVSLPVDVLRNMLHIGRIAFGSFTSPNYMSSTALLPLAPTGQSLPPAPATATIPFIVYLPAMPPPASGYPVVIAGHGIGDTPLGMPAAVAGTLTAMGNAVIAIPAYGHAYGPASAVVLTSLDGTTATVPFPGRAVDINGDGAYDQGEGCIVLTPGQPVGMRDCLRQTALDLAQLSAALRSGIDLDGQGGVPLDVSQIFCFGQSVGSFYGAIFEAIDPGAGAAVLNSSGGSPTEAARWGGSFRPLLQLYFAIRQPSLLNQGSDYNENYPLRYEPVRVNNVPGAIAIQNEIALVEWIETPGAPYSYATHLKSATLPGVPIKRVLFQIQFGDQTVPNAVSTELIRATNVDTVSLYRNDIARSIVSAMPANPHAIAADVLATPAEFAIAQAEQTQAGLFFASGREFVPDVNALALPIFGRNLFEVPVFWPETLNFGQ